ncbi:hypothetical protein JCM6882_003374 [Rhodosporidiobolus microsporus]
MSPPAYAPLPSTLASDPKSASTAPLLSEKPPLSRSPTADALSQDHERTRRPRRALVLAGVVTGALLLVGGAATVGLFCEPGAGVRAWERVQQSAKGMCGYAQGAREELVEGESRGEWKWWKRADSAEGEEGGGVEEFSTSTFKDGRTSTFVKSTRPIVNPGGFTIGTLTGYVPTLVNSTSAPASTTASSSSAAGASSVSATASAEDSFVRETSSVPTKWYAAPTATSSGEDRDDETVFVTETTTITAPASTATVTTTETETITAAPSSAARKLAKREGEDGGGEWDFGDVDAHLLHRRGEAFERAAVESEGEGEGEAQEEKEQEGPKEEYSTSVNRKGDATYTLVKTTRPIVNAGGYTIGTLDGAWVDVAKQTDRTSSSSSTISPSATAAATPAPTEEKEKRAHEELRKREEEEERA